MSVNKLAQANELISKAISLIRQVSDDSPSLLEYEGNRIESLLQALQIINGNEDNYTSNSLTLPDLINTAHIFWHPNV